MRFLLDGKEQAWQSTAKVNVQNALATLAWDLQASNKMVAATLLDGSAYDPELHGNEDITSFGVIEVTTQPKEDLVHDLLTQLIDLSETMVEASAELSGLLYMGDMTRAAVGIQDWVEGMNAVASGLQQLSVLGLRMSPDGPFLEGLERALSETADANDAMDSVRMADLLRTEVSNGLLGQLERLKQWKANLSSGGA